MWGGLNTRLALEHDKLQDLLKKAIKANELWLDGHSKQASNAHKELANHIDLYLVSTQYYNNQEFLLERILLRLDMKWARLVPGDQAGHIKWAKDCLRHRDMIYNLIHPSLYEPWHMKLELLKKFVNTGDMKIWIDIKKTEHSLNKARLLACQEPEIMTPQERYIKTQTNLIGLGTFLLIMLIKYQQKIDKTQLLFYDN